MGLKVFISWSGNESQNVASSLRKFLKRICTGADPWMSGDDLEAGSLWQYRLMKELQSTHFGIICINKTNLEAPWLHFEAGALAKTLDYSAVFPYLVDLSSQSLSGPLALFQSVSADKAGTLKLVTSLNTILRNQQGAFHSDDDLKVLFDALWPGYERELEESPKVPMDAGPERSDTEILAELLELTRTHSRVLASILRASPTYRPPIQAVDQIPNIASDEDFLSLNFEELRYNAKKLRINGQHTAALDLFKKALALRPDDFETLIDIAVTETFPKDSIYEGSIKKLEELIQAHITREKASPTANGNIAKAYYNLTCIKHIAQLEQGASYTDDDIFADFECALKRNPIYAIKALEDNDLKRLKEHPKFKELIEKYRRDER